MQNMTPRQKAGFILLLVAVAVLAVLFWTNARAQGAELPEPTLNIEDWFKSTAALASIVIVVTAFARKHLLPSLDGIAVVVFSIATGAVLGVGGHFLGYLTEGLVGAALFGGTAGWIASGGVDALRGIFGGGNAPLAENSTTAVDAGRTRLQR